MEGLPFDRRILHIAAEAAETTDRNVPTLFLGLKDVLADYVVGTPEANKLRADMWDYDLTRSTNLALKQDFSEVDGSWHTAAELSTITCSACLGYVPENKIEFKQQFLPDVVASLLVVSERIQSLVLKTDDAVAKKQHLMDLRVVLQSLTKLLENYKFLALQVMSAKKYIQLLMTEEEQTCLIMLILTQNILRANMNCLAELNQSRLHGIVDEIVFKIISTQHVSIASSALRVLLLCIDLYPPLLELLSSRRYRGLRSNLKKWTGRGFDEDLRRFSALLEASSAQQMEIVKLNEAAALIQSVYRGHMTRRRLGKANMAIGKFHRMYRERKKRKEEQKTRNIEMKQREELERSRRRNEFLASRTKQLKIIENIPAKTVGKFLLDIESEAACKIQSAWRGFKARKNLAPELANHKKVLAAVTIQRQVRKWLARCRARKAFSRAELTPSGLTSERRAELQDVIAKMREQFPPKTTTFEELKELNEKMFHMLNSHVMELRSKRRREQRINSLLAQLSVDSDTLLNAPHLKDVTREHVELFSSHSRPVAVAARKQHNETLKRLKNPWWKSLMEENDERDLAALRERVRKSGLDDDAEKQF